MLMDRDLFLGEVRRFRGYAALLALLHLGVLVFLNRVADLQQQPQEVDRMFMLVYMAVAFVAALVQLGSYRRPSRWLWLLHRPLPPRAVYLSILAAAALLLGLCVLLPRLLVLLGLLAWSDRVVDSHHLLMPLHAWVLALTAWLAGVCTVLSVRPAVLVMLVLPVWLSWSLAASAPLLLLEALGAAWLLALSLALFRPDREARLPGVAPVLLGALPVQVGVYLALAVGVMVFEFGMMFAGRHPLNMPAPPPGGFTEASHAEPREQLAALLQASADPRAAGWLAQVQAGEPAMVHTRQRDYPVRHQAYQQRVAQWGDEKGRTRWSFSHDRMRFVGHDVRNGQLRGEWGVGGVQDATPFEAVLVAAGPRLLLTPQRLYGVDAVRQRGVELLHLEGDEVFIAQPLLQGRTLLAVTSRQLRLLTLEADGRATPLLAVPAAELLQQPLVQPMRSSTGTGSLARVDFMGLPEGGGWLFALTFGAYHDGESSPQWLLLADAQGQARVVARRTIHSDYPLLYRTAAWWLSPLHYTLTRLPRALLDEGQVLPLRLLAPRHAVEVLAALVLNTLALGLAWWWLRRVRLSGRQRALWLGMAAVGGLPAAISLMLMERRDRPRPLASDQSVPAAGALAGKGLAQ